MKIIKIYPATVWDDRMFIEAELGFVPINGRQLRMVRPREDVKGLDVQRWTLKAGIREGDTGVHLGAIELYPTETPGEGFLGITAKLLRAFRPEMVVREILTQLQEENLDAEVVKRTRKTNLSDDFYKDLAKRCVYWEVHPERPRSVTKQVAEEYGVTRQTVEKWIHEARKRGFLAPSYPGRRTFIRGKGLGLEPVSR